MSDTNDPTSLRPLMTCTPIAPLGDYPVDPDGSIQYSPQYIAVVSSKWWGHAGAKLDVAFMEQTPADLKARILEHANAWGEFANVKFTLTGNPNNAHVRITREGNGYWSYLGRDILGINVSQPTMCLQGFTMGMPESEFKRVVRHEFGHTLGCPHEHARPGIVSKLDPQKTIAWGRQVLGWNEQMVRQQILTPLNEASLMGSPETDEESIMTYQLPASITVDGRPILGGKDFTPTDRKYMATFYPLPNPPPVKPEPPPVKPQPPTTGGKVMGVLKLIRGILVMAQQAAKFTQTTADDNIIAGLIELIDLYESSTVDKKAAANVIAARMFDA